MTSRRSTGIVLAVVTLAAFMAFPAFAAERGIAEWAADIDQDKPGVIMVGSSMQGEGIDFPLLSKELGMKVMDARSGGSMSPWHYCFMNYVMPAAKHKPKLVVVETRMNYIVCPQKRMRLPLYRRAVEAIAPKEAADRVLLDRLAFSSEGRPNWEAEYDDDAKGAPIDGYYWDFNKAVETSFLPSMIGLSKEGGYQLVILLYRARKYAEEPGWEPPPATKFRADMAAYLAKNGVMMLDYTQSPEIKAEMYANGDHISRTTGRPVWTAMVIEDFKALLAGQKPLRLYK